MHFKVWQKYSAVYLSFNSLHSIWKWKMWSNTLFNFWFFKKVTISVLLLTDNNPTNFKTFDIPGCANYYFTTIATNLAMWLANLPLLIRVHIPRCLPQCVMQCLIQLTLWKHIFFNVEFLVQFFWISSILFLHQFNIFQTGSFFSTSLIFNFEQNVSMSLGNLG